MPTLDSNPITILISEKLASPCDSEEEEIADLTKLLAIINSCPDISKLVENRARFSEVLRSRQLRYLFGPKDCTLNPHIIAGFWLELAKRCSEIFSDPLIFLERQYQD